MKRVEFRPKRRFKSGAVLSAARRCRLALASGPLWLKPQGSEQFRAVVAAAEYIQIFYDRCFVRQKMVGCQQRDTSLLELARGNNGKPVKALVIPAIHQCGIEMPGRHSKNRMVGAGCGLNVALRQQFGESASDLVGICADHQQPLLARAGLRVDIGPALLPLRLKFGAHAATAFAASFLPWPRVSHEVVASVASASGVIVM